MSRTPPYIVNGAISISELIINGTSANCSIIGKVRIADLAAVAKNYNTKNTEANWKSAPFS